MRRYKTAEVIGRSTTRKVATVHQMEEKKKTPMKNFFVLTIFISTLAYNLALLYAFYYVVQYQAWSPWWALLLVPMCLAPKITKSSLE